MALSRSSLGVLTVVLVIGGFAGATYWRLRPAAAADGGAQDGSSSPGSEVLSAQEQFNTEIPQPVTGATALQDTLWISVTAAGQAEAIREATLTARVTGMVESVPVRENRSVGQGALLVQIDTTEYALEVDAMAAAMRAAQVDYRARVLFDEELEANASVRAERDRLARSVTGLDQAEVNHRRALLDLEETSVRAPFGGRVANVEVVPGQFVREGDELLTVVALDPIKVEVQVLEAEVGFLSEGRAASLTFAAFPDRTFSGRIETINPLVDPETRTARVTVQIRNPDGRIKPGMYAEVDLEAEQFPDRILVPKAAILERDRRTMLFVFEDGRAKWRYVTTGLENDELIELIEGDEDWVAPGEVVLVDGHHYLTHDAAVRLVEDSAAEGGRPSR